MSKKNIDKGNFLIINLLKRYILKFKAEAVNFLKIFHLIEEQYWNNLLLQLFCYILHL